MADYNRYSVEPEDIPRRRRERKKKKAKSKSRVWLIVKLFIVALLLALIAGLAVAAGAIYALSRDLPSLDDLQRSPLAVNTTIYDRTGKVLIAELHGGENRVLVPTKKIPEVMKQATVAVEDERFYEHHGVDYLGVARAMIENLRAGSVVQGGSTITEQYVKNAYVGDERTYTRKLREAVLAWQLEDRWSKDQILGAYLNTVYYGAGAYGIEAAARTYFHKHASDLNIKEAALLAALPKFPSAYSPTTDKKMATEQRNKVLQLMADQGYVTQEHADKLMASKLHVYQHPPNYNKSLADYFVSYVTNELTKRYGSAMVFDGGLKVITSIDVDVAAGGDRHHQVDHRTARLRVQAVGRARGRRSGQRLHPHHGRRPRLQEAAVQPRHAGQAAAGFRDEALRAHDGGRAGHGPGHHLLLVEEPHHHPDGRLRPAVAGQRRRTGRAGERRPPPPRSPTTSCSRSSAWTSARTTPWTRLTGWASPARWTRSRRSRWAPPASRRSRWPTPTPRWPPAASVTSRRRSSGVERRGKVIWKPTTKGKRAIPAGVASVVTQCLERVASAGTGSATGSYFPYPRAGKTGTTEDGADLWYCGYTPNLSAAVWMGDDDKRSAMPVLRRRLPRADVGQVLRRGAQGPAASELQDVPVVVQPVGGQDAGHVAVRVGVAVGERQRQAEPRSDQDHHAGAGAHQDQAADAAADADQDQAAQADADAHRHAQRRAQAGGLGDPFAGLEPQLRRRPRHDRGRRQRRHGTGRRRRALARRHPGALTP